MESDARADAGSPTVELIAIHGETMLLRGGGETHIVGELIVNCAVEADATEGASIDPAPLARLR